jgi:hypothetical protein
MADQAKNDSCDQASKDSCDQARKDSFDQANSDSCDQAKTTIKNEYINEYESDMDRLWRLGCSAVGEKQKQFYIHRC